MTTITRFEQTTPPTRRNALNGSTAKVLMLSALGRIKPSEAEVAANARSRSAVMRVARRTEVPA